MILLSLKFPNYPFKTFLIQNRINLQIKNPTHFSNKINLGPNKNVQLLKAQYAVCMKKASPDSQPYP